MFEQLDAESIPTESAVWDVSAWDNCKWSTDETCKIIFEAVQRKDGKARPINQWRDALIAEAALKNNLTLLSDDSGLREIVRSLGGNAMGLSQFLEQSGSIPK